LGLFVTRDIVEKFGGKLTVESNWEKGLGLVIQHPNQDRFGDGGPGLQ
jgi:signal transduction histidine kinase